MERHHLRTLSFIVLALVTLSIARQCRADTWGAHLVSLHSPAHGQDDLNLGVYWKGESGATLGVYHNSARRTAAYAGWTFESGPWAVTLGVVYGYQRLPAQCVRANGLPPDPARVVSICGSPGEGSAGALMPLVAPSVRLPELLGVTPRLTLLPPYRGSATVLHLSIEKQL